MKSFTLPPTNVDGYKVDHRRQYPENTLTVFSNLTARGTRTKSDKIVFFGLQYFIKRYLIDDWNENFFSKPLDKVIKKYSRRLDNYLGPNQIGTKHIEDLHALGYLPLRILALPEGSRVGLRIPLFVVHNTDDRFFWLTNAIETILSCSTWLACTSATTAWEYAKLLKDACRKTAPELMDFVSWQAHDFSFRGHSSFESAMISGAAHLTSFTGTDTLPAIDFLEEFYGADVEKELVGGSVAATEHSVMCMGGKEDEYETFRRIIEDLYPSGIVSIVSDTWDFWSVVNPDGGLVARLKDKILARDGKTVIRPDSGDPVKIITGYMPDEIITIGDSTYELIGGDVKGNRLTELEVKGMVQCLWEIFGGTESSVGYKLLDSHIGAIYGDSITLERAQQIVDRLERKGFASTNIVLGIGSYTYQYVTRDTHCFAVKSTFGEVDVNGVKTPVEIFKDPKTDTGMKKSAKGLTAVYRHLNGDYILKDQATWQDVNNCAFRCVFENGKTPVEYTLAEVRKNIIDGSQPRG